MPTYENLKEEKNLENRSKCVHTESKIPQQLLHVALPVRAPFADVN